MESENFDGLREKHPDKFFRLYMGPSDCSPGHPVHTVQQVGSWRLRQEIEMIVNMKQQKYNPKTMVRVDRGTKWGNPYKVNELTAGRERAVTLYRTHLWKMIQTREVTIPELAELHGQTLACWCAPKLCHANIIEAAAAWAQKQHDIWLTARNRKPKTLNSKRNKQFCPDCNSLGVRTCNTCKRHRFCPTHAPEIYPTYLCSCTNGHHT